MNEHTGPRVGRMRQSARRTDRTRVVILGASNVARSFPTLLAVAKRSLGRPLEVLAVAGHGRSYVGPSCFLLRTLSGISQSTIWRDLEQGISCGPNVALVTDIGNDIMYGYQPREIIDAVDSCLDRLAAVNARTVITLLPVCNAPALSRRSCRAMLRLFYPACRVNAETIVARALELNELVRETAAAREITSIQPQPLWYGFDPLHLRVDRWKHVWQTVLECWADGSAERRECTTPRLARLRYYGLRASGLVANKRSAPQPLIALGDGTTISLY